MQEQMNFYKQICEILSNNLNSENVNFILDYNNNSQLNWEEVITSTDMQCYGVLRHDSGNIDYVGNENVSVFNLHVSFAIPIENAKYFNEAIALIDSIPYVLNQEKYYVDDAKSELNGKIGQLLFGYRTDGVNERVNNTLYCVTDLYFQVKVFDGIITSHDSSVKVTIPVTTNGTTANQQVEFLNVANVVFDHTRVLDGTVKGTSTSLVNGSVQQRTKQLIITLVPSSKDNLLKYLMQNEDDDEKLYAVAYNNGIVTRNMNMILVGINENVPTGGSFTDQVIFSATS